MQQARAFLEIRTAGNLESIHDTAKMSPTATTTTTTASNGGSSSSLEIILDYPDWSGPEANAVTRGRFVSALRRSMVGLGFFYLRNSPLEPLRKGLLEATREFFDLGEEEKGRIDQVNSAHFRKCGGRVGWHEEQSAESHRRSRWVLTYRYRVHFEEA